MEKILVLDFGGQYNQLIARRVRSEKVYAEIIPYNKITCDEIVKAGYRGIIFTGGPNSVYDLSSPHFDPAVLTLGIPVLGICYGHQLMAYMAGGNIAPAECGSEYGKAKLTHGDCPIFGGVPMESVCWMSHTDSVKVLPDGFRVTATTDACDCAAMCDEKRRLYGVQFHPEVTHTVQGAAMLNRFVLDICGAKADWIMGDYIEEAVAKIREQVGDEEVILGLSGGVDSSVAAALIHRAIGDQLTCVFVDHGLLRLNEGDMVMDMFEGKLHAKVVRVDASDLFMRELKGVADPEKKRKIIGRLFVDVFKSEAAKLKAATAGAKGATFLAQGTIYPDVIESGGAKSKKAVTIKSHHNVGGLPEQLGLKLLEPLRDLFKDEVRELGVALGLPREMVYRHPFPGPGLGVRILGEVKKEYADLLRRADAIFIEELRNWIDEKTGKSWYDLTSQAFTVFLPVKSVGVMGDGRTYDYVVALRAVITSDFMTADWAELPYGLLKKVSGRIINEVRGINRVTYDVSTKPPATIEWE